MQAAINPSIAFSLINSHKELRWNWHREMKGSLYPLFSLFILLGLFPSLCQGTCLAVSSRVGNSISIHLSTSLPTSTTAATDTQSSVSNLQSTRWHFDLWECCHAITEEQQRRDAKTRWTVFVRVTCCNFVKKWLYRKSLVLINRLTDHFIK